MADILPYYHSSEIVTTSVTERKQICVWWLVGLLRLTYQGELHWRSAIWTEDWLQEEPAKQSLGAEFFREWKLQVPPNRESSRKCMERRESSETQEEWAELQGTLNFLCQVFRTYPELLKYSGTLLLKS